MKTRTLRCFSLLSLFSFLLTTVGCAPPSYRAHPDFESRVKEIKTPGVLPSDVKVYELSAGGVRELRDDWCAAGKENVQRAVTEAFKKTPVQVTHLTIDKDLEDEIEDIRALYRAVSFSIQLHTYDTNQKFPHKVDKFEYSLGPIDKVLDRFGADALVFVYGSDEISTSGRKALQAAGIIMGAFTGVMVVPRSGITAVSVALVDRTGTILWYNMKADSGGYDLRDFDSCSSIVGNLISEFPGKIK